MNRLHFATLGGQLSVVKHLVEKEHCDPGCKTNDYWTPMHFACRGGKIDIIKYLIEVTNCDPKCKNSKGWTPLHLAFYNRRIDIIKYLVEDQRCDLDCRTNDGETPLHLASERGHLDIVKYLIEEQILNCDPHCKQNTGMTPLHIACQYGWLDIVKYLIEEQHCDTGCIDNNGVLPIHFASAGGRLNIVKYLIEEKHCDPTCKQNNCVTPLHIACRNGQLDVAKYLIEQQHCDSSCTTNDGWTPMHFAIASKGGKLDIIKYLITNVNCDPNCKGRNGWTPLHLACYNRHMHIIKYLVEDQHCDLDRRTDDGRTLLHLASERGYLDLVKYLIEEQNCDPHCKQNHTGMTPLHLASGTGQLAIVDYLLEEQHSDPECRTNIDNTPMHLACLNGHLNVVKYLVERQMLSCGQILCCKNMFGQTPLHCACECDSEALNLFRFLVESKCYDLTSKDKLGQTPLHYASSTGHFNICKILVEEYNCSPLAISFYFGTPLQESLINDHIDVFFLLLMNCKARGFKTGYLVSLYYYSMITLDRYQNEIASLLFSLKGLHHYNPTIYRQLVCYLPTIKVFVVGNTLSGKSTLIEALKASTKQTLSGLFSWIWERKVSQVAPHTAGIIPVHIQNDKIGRIIMYDFAGHYEYYSSHAALLETFAFSKGTMIIILLNLRENVTKLVKTLEYWQSFIRNSCYLKGKGPPILVMGSHSDIVIGEGTDPSKKLSLVLKQLKNPICNVGVDLNCTLLSSEGLSRLNGVMKEYYKYSFKDYRFNLKAICFKTFVIKKLLSKCTACLVSPLMFMIKRREEFSILRKCGLLPLTIDELSQTLTTLSECGQLLYLKNGQDVIKGWVIFKPSVLLSRINGTIFSSSNRIISSETGIVPLSKIKELFRYRHRMIIYLMTHLEFCHRISDSEVLLINKCLFSSVDSDSSEEYYFFPALVEQERPKVTWESMKNTHYRCGWCLQRREGIEDQFLSPRFIHVLLLRLAILFGQNPDERCKPQSISIQRECNVWKNGIHFQNMDGVATIVEVVEQSTAVIMVMGCLEGSEMNCVRHRSELIQVILQTKEHFSGTVKMNECLIHPMELSYYPLKSLDCLFTFSINRLARAIVERKKVITRHGTPQGMEKIDSILHFESFSSLTPEIISELFDETNANLEIEESFLYDCARVMSTILDMIQLKEILLQPEQESELIGTIELCHDQYSKDPVYQCFSVLRTWMKFTENPTYKGLREALGTCSVFRGRNPLVSQLCYNTFCALL